MSSHSFPPPPHTHMALPTLRVLASRLGAWGGGGALGEQRRGMVIAVDVVNNNVDRALRDLRRKVMDEGLAAEWREGQHFCKPSERRKMAAAASAKRRRQQNVGAVGGAGEGAAWAPTLLDRAAAEAAPRASDRASTPHPHPRHPLCRPTVQAAAAVDHAAQGQGALA